MTLRLFSTMICALALVTPAAFAADAKPVRLAVVGLAHGHVDGFFRALKGRTDVELVGISDPDTALAQSYAKRYGFAESIFYKDLASMLDRAKPEAVASFTSTFDHTAVVEAAAPRHITVMMEKPLAVDMEHARRIERAAMQGHIDVIVNYETTWYRSHGAMWKLMKEQKAGGEIRRMVAMDGHEGPKEIHVGSEFFSWLTDPEKNGAGALYDFGCYGANLMTWLMDNQKPIAVTALTARNKPAIYPRVDDEATILIQYAKAQGVIEASWNWPFSRKDFEVYGERAYANSIGGNELHVRLPGQKTEEVRTPEALPTDEQDSISYLAAVVRGRMKPAGLSSLANNMIVTEILSAARESAKTGKTVKLN